MPDFVRAIFHSLFQQKSEFPIIQKISKALNFRYTLKAPTRFELVIEVLQTFALPLGYGAISNCNHKNISCGLSDSYGNRTRVTAVKGRCLDRLTTGPYHAFSSVTVVYNITPFINLQPFFTFSAKSMLLFTAVSDFTAYTLCLHISTCCK